MPVRFVDSAETGSILRQATDAERRRGEQAIEGDADQSVVITAPNQALLTWVGTLCEEGYTVTLDRQGIIVAPAPRPGCDTGRVVYSCLLTTGFQLNPDGFEMVLKRPLILDG